VNNELTFVAAVTPNESAEPSSIDATILLDDHDSPRSNCHFDLLNDQDTPIATCVRAEVAPLFQRMDQSHIHHVCVCDRVCTALAQSRYPLREIQCSCDNHSLRLQGRVRRYFHLQMAIEIARLFADGRRIEMQIEIIPPADDHSSAEY
jgi:hypothetical protein